ERLLRRIQRRLVDAALFPQRRPAGFDGGGFKRLGEFGHEGLSSDVRAPAREARRGRPAIVGGPGVFPGAPRREGSGISSPAIGTNPSFKQAARTRRCQTPCVASSRTT